MVEEQELRDAQIVVKVDSKSAKGRKMSKKQMVNDNSQPNPGGRDVKAVFQETSKKTTAAAAKERKLVEVRERKLCFSLLRYVLSRRFVAALSSLYLSYARWFCFRGLFYMTYGLITLCDETIDICDICTFIFATKQ